MESSEEIFLILVLMKRGSFSAALDLLLLRDGLPESILSTGPLGG